MLLSFGAGGQSRRSGLLPGVALVILTVLVSAAPGIRAQQATIPPSNNPQPAQPQNADGQEGPAAATLAIAPGDLLSVDVFNTPELSGKFRVSQSGNVALPQGGVVHVGGLSAIQAGEEIERRLRDAQIMLDPHVTVFVQEYASQGVIVLGEVNRPGTYTLLGEHSLYGAIAAAGGVTGSEGSTITVSHPGTPEQKEVIQVNSPGFSDQQRSTRVNPGDTVYVSRSDVIYVFGEVGHPGAYPIRPGQPLNVLEALSLAQGVEHTAASTKASILRRNLAGGVDVIPVDLKTIYKQGGSDPVLQGSDILVVPRDGVRALLYTAVPAGTAAVLSALITAAIVR